MTPEVALELDAKPLFETAHDVERWSVRARRGDVSLEEFEWGAGGKHAAGEATDEYLLFLTLRRGKRVLITSPDLEPQPGDVATLAIHRPERDAAHALLASWGWKSVDGDSESS